MRKTKLSLTLLITIAFMLVFSTVVAAAAPIAPTLLADDGNTEVYLEWQAGALEDLGTIIEYKVYQDGAAIATVAPKAGADVDTTYSYIVSGLTNDTEYSFEVSTVNPEGETKSLAVLVTPSVYDALNPEGLADVTDQQTDSGVDSNANQTGSGVNSQDNAGEVIKSDDMTSTDGTTTQRTHGEYHNNTNSCASCHQTHTGASKSLLFKDGVYNTCSACHDGTLGFYNVFESHSELGSAGTFGGTDAGNMSVHLANGATTLSAAPGGNINGEGSWTNEFNCASCHSPHGSYSDRLLHYSPNGMATTAKADGGIAANGAPIYNFAADVSAELTAKTPFIIKRGTATEFLSVDATLDFTGVDPTLDTVMMVYKFTAGSYGGPDSYKLDPNPWLYGYVYGSPKNYYTRFYSDPGTDAQLFKDGTKNYPYVIDDHDQEDGAVHFEYDKGYIWATDTSLDNLLSGDVARSYVVKLDLMPIWDADKDLLINGGNADGQFTAGEEKTFGDLDITTVNQRALYAGETSTLSTNILERWGVTPGATVKNWGVAMSDYCASCHTDYLAKSGSSTGTWNQAYRHSTTSDSYTCVRCHFAHGTDVEIMRDAQNNTAADLVTAGTFGDLATAEAYMLDKNNSSALKRYTNMAVCWACHTSSKAEQLKNTDSYGDEDPHGLNVEEGKQNWPN